MEGWNWGSGGLELREWRVGTGGVEGWNWGSGGLELREWRVGTEGVEGWNWGSVCSNFDASSWSAGLKENVVPVDRYYCWRSRTTTVSSVRRKGKSSSSASSNTSS